MFFKWVFQFFKPKFSCLFNGYKKNKGLTCVFYVLKIFVFCFNFIDTFSDFISGCSATADSGCDQRWSIQEDDDC